MYGSACGMAKFAYFTAGIHKAEAIFAAQEQKSELDRLTPKNFYPLRGGKGVTYVDSVGRW